MGRFGKCGSWAVLFASLGILITAMPAKAVTYTVSGTGINQPDVGVSFSFTLDTPDFVTSFTEFSAAQLSSCSIGSAAYACSGVAFLPNQPEGALGNRDHIEFFWTNTDDSGEGNAQLLFALGAFNTPGTYVAGPFSFSSDAVLRVDAPSEVPLPAALPLFASALFGGGVMAWRNRRKEKASAAAA
jgi:hypothetical protein